MTATPVSRTQQANGPGFRKKGLLLKMETSSRKVGRKLITGTQPRQPPLLSSHPAGALRDCEELCVASPCTAPTGWPLPHCSGVWLHSRGHPLPCKHVGACFPNKATRVAACNANWSPGQCPPGQCLKQSEWNEGSLCTPFPLFSSQAADTRPEGWTQPSTLLYPARHLVSTRWQRRAPCP